MNRFSHSSISNPVKTLLIVNIALYILTILPGIGRTIIEWGSLIPVRTFASGQVWRLFTYMFLHDPNSPFHLLFNMLALWMFSQEIEVRWGSRRFIEFYFISGIGAGCFSLVHLFIPAMSYVGVIGASGAVLALLTVYAWYYPHREILLFFLIPVNIRVVVIGYALISLFGTLSPHGVVSHVTHLGGILVALAYLKWYSVVTGWISETQSRKAEQQMRQRALAVAERKKTFDEQIDPILAKISSTGMESLTPHEKKLLEKAAHSADRQKLKQGKVLPFISFKKGDTRK